MRLFPALRIYGSAIRQLPIILGRAWMFVIAILTSISATLGYLDVKQEKPLVGWWEGLPPLWGAILPVLAVAIVLFLLAVHKQIEEIEQERDELKRELEKRGVEASERPPPTLIRVRESRQISINEAHGVGFDTALDAEGIEGLDVDKITGSRGSAGHLDASHAELPAPQQIPSRDLLQPHLKGLSFRIADLVGDGALINNRTFENCTIHGPAIIGLIHGNRLEGITFVVDGDNIEPLLSEVSPDKPVIGVIGLRNCTLSGCTLDRIGIAAPPPVIKEIRAAFRGIEGGSH